MDVARLKWACGPTPPDGWINADPLRKPAVAPSGDIRRGLALPDDSVDDAVAIHGLRALPYLDGVPALRELRRVLRPGGVLQRSVPDLERSIAAWRRGDRAFFYIPDDEVACIGGKLVVQATWYGTTRTSEIVALDNRERESLLAEALE